MNHSQRPLCAECEREIFLIVENGEAVEHPQRPGILKVCCACGYGALPIDKAETLRRAEIPARVYLDTRPYVNQYGSSLRDRPSHLKELNPYQRLRLVS